MAPVLPDLYRSAKGRNLRGFKQVDVTAVFLLVVGRQVMDRHQNSVRFNPPEID